MFSIQRWSTAAALPSLSGIRLEIVSLRQGKYANLNYSRQGVNSSYQRVTKIGFQTIYCLRLLLKWKMSVGALHG